MFLVRSGIRAYLTAIVLNLNRIVKLLTHISFKPPIYVPEEAMASGLSSLNVMFVTLERKRRVSPFERRFFTSLRSDQNDKLKFND